MRSIKTLLLAAALSTGAAAFVLAPVVAHACDGHKKGADKQADKEKKDDKNTSDKKS